MSDRSGKSGYSRLGDTGAAILQKECELSSSLTKKETCCDCRRTGEVDCIQCTATFVCLQEIKVLQASRPSLSTQLLLNLWHFGVLHSKEHDFNCQVHCG